jgi:acetyl-CoA/propionyl-CoA carboxylase biotin carboxyl carrier protein
VITNWQPPSGPGVRVDAGFGTGDVIGGNFDSLLGKLIITGANRQEALARARRALNEFVVEGMPTALPFHRAVVSDDAFNSASTFRVHTRWIETEFVNEIPVFSAGSTASGDLEKRETITVEVDGRRIEVSLPAGIGAAPTTPKRSLAKKSHAAATGASLVAPMQGTVVKIAVAEGDVVAEGALVLVVEAMKMEQPLLAHRAGRITNLSIEVGETVASGVVLCEIVE